VLTTGSAFVAGLTAEMVDARDVIRLMPVRTDESGRPGRYPTPALRVALCNQVLAAVGVAAPTDWPATYGTQLVGNSRTYAADVPVIVEALVSREWTALGRKRLDQVLPWDAQHEGDAHTVALKTLTGEVVPVVFDVRRWVAAATHAYWADPDTYTRLDLDSALARDITSRPAGRARSSHSPRERLMEHVALPEAVDLADAMRDADRRAGAALARRLHIT
jgi:hypothetical protein